MVSSDLEERAPQYVVIYVNAQTYYVQSAIYLRTLLFAVALAAPMHMNCDYFNSTTS